MKKYKVCPACGVHNNPVYLECLDCEMDLQNVPVVDAQTEQQHIAEDTPEAMVRLCDCGARNPVQARRCTACGEDISMVVPTPDSPRQEEQPHYILSSLDGSFAYEITEGSLIVGRENQWQEYLASKPYVGRRHAILTLDKAGNLTITNCNSTNFTFVNNRMLQVDAAVSLKDGDEIGLGGNGQDGTRQSDAAYFLVRIGPCT